MEYKAYHKNPSKSHHKHAKHKKRHYKRVAAAIAAAAIMSAAMLPGVSAGIAYASENPNAGSPPAVTLQETAAPKAPENVAANAQKVVEVKATAYAPGAADNDQWGNKTHLGTQIRPGVIAVDPKVIPLGSKVFIQYPDGHGEYAVAEDTGGAIKGNRIDVAKWSRGEANDFGIKHLKVYVLSTPEKSLG
jgi:3D (Asp-Asp-Asp) domain-containing protein